MLFNIHYLQPSDMIKFFLKIPLLHFLNLPHKYLSIHKALTFQGFQISDQCAKNNQIHVVQQT
jgi:hypothetical protein